MARCVENPSELGDIMPVGFGSRDIIDDKLTEEGEGRGWDDHRPEWAGKEEKRDGFASTLRMVSVLPEGNPLGGVRVREWRLRKWT